MNGNEDTNVKKLKLLNRKYIIIHVINSLLINTMK